MAFTIILLILVLFMWALLIVAYVITPVVSWLAANPIGGVFLLGVVVVLTALLVFNEIKEREKD